MKRTTGKKEEEIEIRTLTKAAICCVSLLMVTSMVLPAITTATPSTCYVGGASIVHYAVGDDCTEAENDTGKLIDWITSDSHWQQKFWNKEDKNHKEQWEYTQDQDTNGVETAHFVYYAGHGFSDSLTRLVFKKRKIGGKVISYDSPRIVLDHCDWGDECGHRLKWVALATCYVGNRTYKALDGVHLICGCKCYIDEALYGDRFGYDMISEGMSIKESWFDTMDLNVNVVDGIVNVVGEDSSVGNDHIYWHGSVADDPTVDNYYYEWTHNPNTGEDTEGSHSKPAS
jgi:hypothetical protein